MDDSRFDALARSVSANRRVLIDLFASGTLAVLTAVLDLPFANAKKRKAKKSAGAMSRTAHMGAARRRTAPVAQGLPNRSAGLVGSPARCVVAPHNVANPSAAGAVRCQVATAPPPAAALNMPARQPVSRASAALSTMAWPASRASTAASRSRSVLAVNVQLVASGKRSSAAIAAARRASAATGPSVAR
jgi:hypothetical protein